MKEHRYLLIDESDCSMEIIVASNMSLLEEKIAEYIENNDVFPCALTVIRLHQEDVMTVKVEHSLIKDPEKTISHGC